MFGARFGCSTLPADCLQRVSQFHPSLKPENVVIAENGYPKLTDLGLAKDNVTQTGGAFSVCGTPEYMAPEVLKRQEYGCAIDWWALGILTFELLTGMVPYMPT